MIKEWWERITGIAALRNRVAFLETENKALRASMMEAHDRAQMRREALCDIAAMETPKSNGTVRRMAKRAREVVTFADRMRHAYVKGGAVIDVSTFDRPAYMFAGGSVATCFVYADGRIHPVSDRHPNTMGTYQTILAEGVGGAGGVSK